MRFPNLRYGSPDELRHYAAGIPVDELARQLRRDPRTVRDWLDGRRRVPFWVPELLRLRHAERCQQLRRIGIRQYPCLLSAADTTRTTSVFCPTCGAPDRADDPGRRLD